MANVFIFHGVCGFPEENWFPWLKKRIEPLGHTVFVPQFPTPEKQTLESWLKVLEQYKEHLTRDSVLVGHSLGVPFTLNVIEQNPAKAAFLVAGFVGATENEFDEGMKTFAQRDFDWSQIKSNCKYFKIYHADNDPYLSMDKAERVSKGLGVDVAVIKNGGHLNTIAGYDTFDLLYENITKVL